MFKKSIISTLLLVVMFFVLVTPAFAQETSTPPNKGLIGSFAQLISKIFSQIRPPMKEASREAQEVPSKMGEENRLEGLVKAGKITETQKESILAEVQKIKDEITAWSKSTGLEEGYIYGGLRGPGMDAGVGAPTGTPSGKPRQMPPQGKPSQTPPQYPL